MASPNGERTPQEWNRQALIAVALCVGLALLSLTTEGGSRALLGLLAVLLGGLAVYARAQGRRVRDERRRREDLL